MIRCLALALVSLTLGQGIAQETLDPYVVEGALIGDGVPTSGFSQKTLSRASLAQRPGSTLSDQLLGQGGLKLFRRQSDLTAHPTTQGANLRVAGPNGAGRTTLYLDGVPMNDAFGGWIPWTALNSLSLSYIQIIQPSGVDPWGNPSLGGSVWLQSDLEQDYWRFESVFGNTLDHRLSNAFSLTTPEGSTKIFGSWSSIQSDGYPVIKASQRGLIDEKATLDTDSASLGIHQSLAGQWSTSAELRYHEEDRGNGTPLATNDQQSWQARISLEKGRGRDDWEGRLTGYWQERDFASTFTSVSADRLSELAVLDQVDVPSSHVGLSWHSRHWLSDTHEFLLSVSGERLTGSTNELFRNLGQGFTRLREAGGERWLAGLTLGHRWQATPAFMLDSRIHVDRSWDRQGHEIVGDLANGNILTSDHFDSSSDWEISGRIGLEWEATDATSLHWSTFTGTRRPTLNELYRPFRVGNDITLANPNLDSERLWGTTFGVEWDPDGAWSMHLEGFWQRMDDGIANVTLAEGGGNVSPWGFIPEGGSGRQRRNLSEVTIKGVEAELNWQHDSGWQMEIGYLLTDSEITRSGDQPALEGKTLSQMPTHQAFAALSYDANDRFTARMEARWVGAVFEDDLNARSLDSYVSVNAQIGWRWTEEVSTFLAVQNLFDEEIQVSRSGSGLIGIGAPRLVHFGLRLDY